MNKKERRINWLMQLGEFCNYVEISPIECLINYYSQFTDCLDYLAEEK